MACVLAGVLVAACMLAVTPAEARPGRSGPTKDSKHTIEDLEQQWRVAQLAGDAGAMDKLLADDYVGISMTGQVNTKAQQLDRLKTRKLVLTRMDLADTKVKLLGRVAIVTGLAAVDGINDGEHIQGEYRFTRVYQRVPQGVWKITNFEVTLVPHLKQGRP